MGLAVVVSYPMLMRQTRPYRAQDPVHDLVFLSISSVICCGALAYHWDGIGSTLGLL